MYGTGAWVRAEGSHQSTQYSDTQPMATSPGHTNMPMVDARFPQEWSDLEWLSRFYRSGGGQERGHSASTQETFSWHPRAPLHHRDNSIVSGMLSGPPVVNMQQVSNLLADADQSTRRRPHVNTHPRASNTHQRVSSLGPSVPVQSVSRLYSSSQGSAVNYVGSNSFALASRVAPPPSLIPPAGQQRNPTVHNRIAADNPFVLTGPEGHLSDRRMHHGGQARLVVGGQGLGADTNESVAFVFCPVPNCGKRLRNDRVGLRYESHANILPNPG